LNDSTVTNVTIQLLFQAFFPNFSNDFFLLFSNNFFTFPTTFFNVFNKKLVESQAFNRINRITSELIELKRFKRISALKVLEPSKT